MRFLWLGIRTVKSENIAHMSHEFDDNVSSRFHSKLDCECCLEVFQTDEDAERIIKVYNQLEGSKHTESVNIIPQS